MKNIMLKIIFLSLLFLTIRPVTIFAQTVNDYLLIPDPEMILPIGGSTKLTIYWNTGIGTPQFGTKTQFLNVTPPTWTLNGKPSNAPANSEGRLLRDLTFTTAAYYAPDKVPKINPVTIAVKFRANDSTKEEVTLVCNVKIVDPGQNWVFTYTCTQSSLETWESPHKEHTRKINVNGYGYLVVDAPPEQDGYVSINTEQGDPVIRFSVNGNYSYNESTISTGLNNEIEEKRITNYSGKPEQKQGLLFEYNLKDKGDQGGIQDAGMSFDITRTDEIWNHDANGKLRSSSSKVNEKNWATNLLVINSRMFL